MIGTDEVCVFISVILTYTHRPTEHVSPQRFIVSSKFEWTFFTGTGVRNKRRGVVCHICFFLCVLCPLHTQSAPSPRAPRTSHHCHPSSPPKPNGFTPSARVRLLAQDRQGFPFPPILFPTPFLRDIV